MKTIVLSAPVLIFCVAILRADQGQLKADTESKTACHGTAVEFVASPVAAAALAGKQKKLVFVLHVSGHFEDPTFT
jgi:hypothetical protein